MTKPAPTNASLSELDAPGGIGLWYVLLDNTVDAARHGEYRALLSPEESEQERRFTHEATRLQFLVGRALLRTVLSHYSGHDPRTFEFRHNRHGKPTLRTPLEPPLEFNLSHTHGLVVCAVTLRDAVGVDVEHDSRRITASLELARRFFTPEETAALMGLSPERQQTAFLQLWTLKEAFVKARGASVYAPPAGFSFLLSADGPPAVSSTGLASESPRDWQFARGRLALHYHAALAVRRPASTKLAVSVRRAPPSLTATGLGSAISLQSGFESCLPQTDYFVAAGICREERRRNTGM